MVCNGKSLIFSFSNPFIRESRAKMEVHTLFRTILFPNLKVKDITGEKLVGVVWGPGREAERSGFEICQGHCVVF